MNYEDKISQAIENSKIQNRLRHAGVYPMIGPTGPMGPSGKGLEINGSYNSLEELKKIKGIGRVKASRLKAAFELAKRLSRPIENELFVYSSKDVAKVFMEELRFEKREIVKVVILNNKNKIVRIIDASFGGTNFAVIEPKEILAEPIKMGADKIILIHNHPSGNATPSQEDFEVTKRIKLCADLFGIKLLDHIVIGDGEFKSAFL